MKPLIVYINNDKKISLTREEFEQFIKDAYNNGYNEGYRDGVQKNWWPSWTYTTTSGNATNHISPTPTLTGTPNITYGTQITCEAHNAKGD